MSTKKLEAIADAISRVNQYLEPESDSYGLRNPGLLTKPPIKGPSPVETSYVRERTYDEQGRRIFNSHRAGYQALLDALEKRCLYLEEKPFKKLLSQYGISYSRQVGEAVDFVQRSLSNLSVTAETPVSFFLKD